jgi:hypothetical protein
VGVSECACDGKDGGGSVWVAARLHKKVKGHCGHYKEKLNSSNAAPASFCPIGRGIGRGRSGGLGGKQRTRPNKGMCGANEAHLVKLRNKSSHVKGTKRRGIKTLERRQNNAKGRTSFAFEERLGGRSAKQCGFAS